MADTILAKHQLEKALHDEKVAVSSGRLKDENPLDTSADFRHFSEACRRGDLRLCQELISKGINVNARDEFDYTPLILASLCGHYEVAQLLLESGARCERDTFQGERCLYNALNDRIRNLLLSYDFSKTTDPLQPLAAHITSLLSREIPKTADIAVHTSDATLNLHKFVLSARSPYFAKKLDAAPETTVWKLATGIPTQSFETCIRYLYLGDVGADLGEGEEEQAILTGIDKLSRQLEVPELFENLLQSGDRRQARQRRTEDLEKGRDQMARWFEENVLKQKTEVDRSKVDDVKWDRDNAIFADVLLRADEDDGDDDEEEPDDDDTDLTPLADQPLVRNTAGPLNGIPIGPLPPSSPPPSTPSKPTRTTTLYPCHRALLLRSDFFATMFASPFREAQPTPTLPIIPLACSPAVLEILLRFLYTEHADFPLALAMDVLGLADMLFLERLKQRAALLISTLGNGSASTLPPRRNPRAHPGGVADPEPERDEEEIEPELDIYALLRLAWQTRVPRLETFAARYIAYRLETYLPAPEFRAIVLESAGRIRGRQETDTVELVDDVRYFLSERFRLRFEESGLGGLMDEGDGDEGREMKEAVGGDVAEGVVQAADEAAGEAAVTAEPKPANGEREEREDEGYSGSSPPDADADVDSQRLASELQLAETQGVVRTLDGEVAGDEFAQDAVNYRVLLGRIETLMEELGLDG
ncbi:hypothetical protein LTR35_000664 [Friedmanniomyces endolithicus]|uniref:BTB domain-containing protein n=1 Tax=Friedmanniomyces endolithicus TaxID=329885 RepID=A0AAN6F9P4_9PEZI|nr:hypothetical protein LTS00_012183 [Friedmanniomyces endolithicus]KAK0292633.1 hypothetical protein LTR35_000664 [Friedmanniomyces endolithicus]KAK0305983.1 hypothetical protein LTR82_016539 [Friedmanniomyces endolithicus]KAK1007625.1 hypothetical protein LTR54_006351 [Friedmanniomyces endolithicus]